MKYINSIVAILLMSVVAACSIDVDTDHNSKLVGNYDEYMWVTRFEPSGYSSFQVLHFDHVNRRGCGIIGTDGADIFLLPKTFTYHPDYDLDLDTIIISVFDWSESGSEEMMIDVNNSVMYFQERTYRPLFSRSENIDQACEFEEE